MSRMTVRGTVGTCLIGLAAAGVSIRSVQAQQPLPRIDMGERAGQPAADKEVTLAADGSFRAAVITRAGNLVPGARLTFTPRQPGIGSVISATTGSAGITVVAGTKAGLYGVHVEAPQGTYDGTLRVRSSTETEQAQAVLPPLVTFVLTSATVEDADEVPGQNDPARRRRLLAAGALGATAIAVPLSVRPVRRASP